MYFLGGKSTIQDTCHGLSMTTYYLTMTIHNHFDDCLRLTYSNISMFYIFMYNLLKWKKKLKRPFYLFDQTMFIKIVYHNISRSAENYIPQYVLCLLRQFNMFNQFGGKYVKYMVFTDCIKFWTRTHSYESQALDKWTPLNYKNIFVHYFIFFSLLIIQLYSYWLTRIWNLFWYFRP